jgi:hypothetical protein
VEGSNQTLVQKWLTKLQNKPSVAIVVTAAIILVATATLVEKLKVFVSVFDRLSATPFSPREALAPTQNRLSEEQTVPPQPSTSVRSVVESRRRVAGVESDTRRQVTRQVVPSGEDAQIERVQSSPDSTPHTKVAAPASTPIPSVAVAGEASLDFQLQQSCGAGFQSFDATTLEKLVRENLRLRGGYRGAARLHIAAGYVSESVLQDPGTTVRAYASITLCDGKSDASHCEAPTPHCNNPCIYSDDDHSRAGNVGDAAHSIARLVAELIRDPTQHGGVLACSR